MGKGWMMVVIIELRKWKEMWVMLRMILWYRGWVSCRLINMLVRVGVNKNISWMSSMATLW